MLNITTTAAPVDGSLTSIGRSPGAFSLIATNTVTDDYDDWTQLISVTGARYPVPLFSQNPVVHNYPIVETGEFTYFRLLATQTEDGRAGDTNGRILRIYCIGLLTGTSQGLEGDQGTVGGAGNQGYQGVQGEQGVQGVQGEQGLQGAQGNQGSQGNQGIQGIQGIQGNQGFQGIGFQGFQGSQAATTVLSYANRVGAGTASADTDGSSPYTADKAFDGNAIGTFFESNTVINWLKYDFGSDTTYKINAMSMRVYDGYEERAPRDFYLAGSNDDSSYTILDTIVDQNYDVLASADSQVFNWHFTNNTAYRYIKLFVKTVPFGTILRIADVRYYEGLSQGSVGDQGSQGLVGGGGKVLQVLNNSNQPGAVTNTSFATAATQAITPADTNNKVLITAAYNIIVSADSMNYEIGDFRLRLYRGTTALGTEQKITNGDTSLLMESDTPAVGGAFTFLDSPSTTSATTYNFKYKGVGTSPSGIIIDTMITVMEVE
jgi:hypothetical protein